jgi:hypothetical protein
MIRRLRARWQRFLDRYLEDWNRAWGIETPDDEVQRGR